MNTRHQSSASRQAPVWRQQLDASRQRARAWWNERSAQERKLLRLCAIVVIAALVWTVALQPAMSTIEQARKQLPRLRADAAQVDALILEAQALQRGQTGKIDDADLSQALRITLQRAGLEDGTTLSESPHPSAGSIRQWEVSLLNASAAHVMEWLASLPYLLQLQIWSVELVRSSVDGRDKPGYVTGRIVVQQPERPVP